MDQLDVAELVRLAGARDQAAWNELVRRYGQMVWRIACGYRLGQADANDVSQNTWIKLAEQLGRLRDPEKLPGWLASTTRRECLRVLKLRRREVLPSWWPDTVAETAVDHCPEEFVLHGARDRLLWQAFGALPDRCRRLLALMANAPDLSYVQIGQALGMKTGSVGPSRGRCLHELRRKLALLGMCEGAAG